MEKILQYYKTEWIISQKNFTFNFCFRRTRPRFAPLDQRLFPLLCSNKRGTGLTSGTCPLILSVALGTC